MAARIDGLALGMIAAGGLFAYAGVRGYSIPHAIQSLIQGQAPGAGGHANQIGGTPGTAAGGSGTVTATGGNASGGTNAQNEALGKQMAAAAPYNWTGTQWVALDNIVMAESGWSDTIANPTSTARGIAQNINGWGPGYEEGNAAQQIAWLLNYVRGRYGSPVLAWAFHLANGWY